MHYRSRCLADPLDDDLVRSGALTADLLEQQSRSLWELCMRLAGVPRRRQLRYVPWSDDRPIILVVDGALHCNLGAWQRLVSLVPGAVARPSRTAASFGVDVADVRPPDARRSRIVDFVAARRAQRRQRRAERSLTADLARFEAALEHDSDDALDSLPDYALAARLTVSLTLPTSATAVATALLGQADAAARAARGDGDRGLRAAELDGAARTARLLLRRHHDASRHIADLLAARLAANGRVANPASAEALTVADLVARARGGGGGGRTAPQ